MFGRKRDITIGDSLSRTRPVRYSTVAKNTFKRARPASSAPALFGNGGMTHEQRLAAAQASDAMSGAQKNVKTNGVAKPLVTSAQPKTMQKSPASQVAPVAKKEPARTENGFDKEAMERLTDCKNRVLVQVVDMIDAEAAAELTPTNWLVNLVRSPVRFYRN